MASDTRRRLKRIKEVSPCYVIRRDTGLGWRDDLTPTFSVTYIMEYPPYKFAPRWAVYVNRKAECDAVYDDKRGFITIDGERWYLLAADFKRRCDAQEYAEDYARDYGYLIGDSDGWNV